LQPKVIGRRDQIRTALLKFTNAAVNTSSGLPTGAHPQPAATVIVSSGDSCGPLTLVVLPMLSGAGITG